MKKVLSFEIGDESMQDNYARYTIRIDMRKAVIALLAALIVCIVLVLGFGHSKQINKFDLVQDGHPDHHSAMQPISNAFASPILLANSTSNLNTFPETERQRKFVLNMAANAWKAYKTFAFGANNLKPKSQRPDHLGGGPVSAGGLTLIKSMSTLWVMGLKEEFEQAQQWIENKFDFANSSEHSYVFVSATEYLGSFLSCYALTNDTIFLQKAKEVAKALEPAFNTITGMPAIETNFL